MPYPMQRHEVAEQKPTFIAVVQNLERSIRTLSHKPADLTQAEEKEKWEKGLRRCASYFTLAVRRAKHLRHLETLESVASSLWGDLPEDARDKFTRKVNYLNYLEQKRYPDRKVQSL